MISKHYRDSQTILDDFGSKLSNATSELREDINAFFIGTVETGLVPNILKGSIYLNEVYGLVNRTGLIVAGVALVGISGDRLTLTLLILLALFRILHS